MNPISDRTAQRASIIHDYPGYPRAAMLRHGVSGVPPSCSEVIEWIGIVKEIGTNAVAQLDEVLPEIEQAANTFYDALQGKQIHHGIAASAGVMLKVLLEYAVKLYEIERAHPEDHSMNVG